MELYPWLRNLPPHWRVAKLGYVAKISTGTADVQDSFDDGEYPFFIRSPKVKRLPYFTHDTEAILTAGDGNVGDIFHHFIGKFVAHQRVYIVEPGPLLYGRYLYYVMMQTFKDSLGGNTAKSTVESLRRPMLTSFQIPLPPIEEQKKIADELGRKLAEIDEFIADQIKLKELLKEQFEAQKEQIILEAEGQQVRLSRVLKGLKDGTHGTHPRVNSGGEVLLSAKNISSGELIISEDESRISLEEAAQITASGFPQKGDVMMILVGATYGRTAIYNLEQTLPFQRSVGFFRPNEDLITSDYLKLVMSSSGFQQQLTLGIKTSAQPGIYLGDVASCTISLPNRSSQVSIVNKYHSAEKIYNEITADINESIEHLIESRNSLLLTSLYS